MSVSTQRVCCPLCHGEGTILRPASNATTVEEGLRAICQERGYVIFRDGFVDRRAAADLIGISPKTLDNWKHQNDDRTPINIKHSGRCIYSLQSLSVIISKNIV